MSARTTLVFVRHGEVEERYRVVFGGRIDMGLSPNGRAQAGRLASYLRSQHFDAVYASPMRRVRETIEPLLALNGHEPRFSEGLREVDFGAWTGLTWEQVRERFGVSPYEWLDLLHRDAVPGAEPAAAFRQRVGNVLSAVLDAHPGQRVAIVCHGGVIRMALSLLLQLPLPCMAGFEVSNASLTVVEHRRGKPEVMLLNFAPWRDLA
jgi:broad specificity phosphatase PhoE